MKKLILCQHLDSIQEYLPITYTTSINNTNNIKLILPYHRTSVEVPSLNTSRVSLTKYICKGISELHLTSDDRIYACVSLCECV